MHYIDRGMHSHANQANDHKRATKLSECKCWNMSSNTEASQQNGNGGHVYQRLHINNLKFIV